MITSWIKLALTMFLFNVIGWGSHRGLPPAGVQDRQSPGRGFAILFLGCAAMLSFCQLLRPDRPAGKAPA